MHGYPKVLGVKVNAGVNWRTHIETRLKEANRFLGFSNEKKFPIFLKGARKLGLYKFLMVPVLIYEFHCGSFLRTDIASQNFRNGLSVGKLETKQSLMYIHCRKATSFLCLLQQLNDPLVSKKFLKDEQDRCLQTMRNCELFELSKNITDGFCEEVLIAKSKRLKV